MTIIFLIFQYFLNKKLRLHGAGVVYGQTPNLLCFLLILGIQTFKTAIIISDDEDDNKPLLDEVFVISGIVKVDW